MPCLHCCCCSCCEASRWLCISLVSWALFSPWAKQLHWLLHHCTNLFEPKQTRSSAAAAGRARTLAPALGTAGSIPLASTKTQTNPTKGPDTPHAENSRCWLAVKGHLQPPLPLSSKLSPLASQCAHQLAHIGLPAGEPVCKCWRGLNSNRGFCVVRLAAGLFVVCLNNCRARQMRARGRLRQCLSRGALCEWVEPLMACMRTVSMLCPDAWGAANSPRTQARRTTWCAAGLLLWARLQSLRGRPSHLSCSSLLHSTAAALR